MKPHIYVFNKIYYSNEIQNYISLLLGATPPPSILLFNASSWGKYIFFHPNIPQTHIHTPC